MVAFHFMLGGFFHGLFKHFVHVSTFAYQQFYLIFGFLQIQVRILNEDILYELIFFRSGNYDHFTIKIESFTGRHQSIGIIEILDSSSEFVCFSFSYSVFESAFHADGNMVLQIGNDEFLFGYLFGLFLGLALIQTNDVFLRIIFLHKMMNFLFEKFLNFYTFMTENFNGHLKTKPLLICQFVILSSNHLFYSLLEYILSLFDIKNFVSRHFSKTVQIFISCNLHVLTLNTQIINIFNYINQLQLII